MSGRWALVFSTQTARPKESAAKSIMDLPQEVSNAIYSVLFKVAPFLAGGQERRRQAFSVANEQTVDEAAGTVDNSVTLTQQTKNRHSRLRRRATHRRRRHARGLAARRKRGSAVSRLIHLPRPVGRIVTTFVDDDLRLSRGSRGGQFVLKRIR